MSSCKLHIRLESSHLHIPVTASEFYGSDHREMSWRIKSTAPSKHPIEQLRNKWIVIERYTEFKESSTYR